MTNELSAAILKTLAYRDLFQYPLTEEEIRRFLFEKKATQPAIKKVLAKMVAAGQVGKRGRFYFLPGREVTIPLRLRREKISQRKVKRAACYSRFLRLIPWVKAVFITGAVAVGNAEEPADLDILIVTTPKRLWLSRLLVFFILILLRAKRKHSPGPDPDKVCPNMFFSLNCLVLPDEERNLYTAHEVVQARLLWERGPVHHQFLMENSWVKGFLPNWQEEGRDTRYKDIRRAREYRRSLCPRIFVSLFDLLENAAYELQLRYMARRRTREIVTPERILFHSIDLPKIILEAYGNRLQKLSWDGVLTK